MKTRVLWIVNLPFGYHYTLLNKNDEPVASGTWIYAAYESSKKNTSVELHIATVYNITQQLEGIHEGVVFHVLPGGSMSNYAYNSNENIHHWEMLKKKINPDLLFIWGTEAKFSYTASKVFSDIKIAIYMQGVIGSIVNHFYDGIPFSYKYKTLRDIVGLISGKDTYQIFKKHITLEYEMISKANAIIVENNWCEDYCKSINSNLICYRNFLPIRNAFYDRIWNIKKIQKYTIFTNAGGVTIKGHHILFKALAIVKKIYPCVKLYIPGINYIEYKKGLSRQTGYFEMLQKLYYTNNLKENIEFVGTLSAKDMTQYIAKSNVYVMPSLVENHSSSLIEAMIVGAPCVSSLVGGIADTIQHGYNGFVYNSLEPTSLAGYIIRVFSDEHLARRISVEALKIRSKRNSDFGDKILQIYQDIITQ